MRDHDDTKLNVAGKALQTPAGKAMQTVVMGLFAIVVSTLLSLILASINNTNAIAQAARDKNFQQDQEIALLQVQTQALQRVSDATVASLQAITLQMTKNEDALEQVGNAQKNLIQGTRPK